MPEEVNVPPPANDLSNISSLQRESQAQREESLKHDCHESERAGHDVGIDRALTDWIIKHRSKWRESRLLPTQP
jgi:hypothetical protein